jgi:hypothetical protein
MGEGWFIDLETGKEVLIYEHHFAVMANPKRYRMTAEEIEGRSREEILRLVFKRGFIRVRDSGGEVHFEFDADRQSAMRQIRDFCKAKYGRSHALAVINDHRKGERLTCKIRELGRVGHVWKTLQTSAGSPSRSEERSKNGPGNVPPSS